MITIKINNEEINIKNDFLLTTVLQTQGYSEGCFAVAVNRQFVPRSQYTKTLLNNGDNIEIIAPMQGG